MKEVGESALEAALPWDRIAGVPFQASAGGSGGVALPVATLASAEDVRAQHDPDYRWLVSDIAAIDTIREQKSVSLNLKVRKDERAREDKDRLDRENSRRAAKNLAPIKTIEDLDKSDKDNKDDTPDQVVLIQAAEIMADMVVGAHPTPAQAPQKTARRS